MSDSEVNYLAEAAATAYDLYMGSRNINHLHHAIWCYEECLDALSEGHAERQSFLVELVKCLGDRYDQFKDTSDLETVILYSKELTEVTPHDNPERGGYLHTVSTWLGRRYDDMEDIDDLEESIQYGQEAVAVTPEDDPGRVEYLYNLACNLGDKYETTKDIEDIEQAILYASEALTAAPVGDPGQVDRQINLARWLSESYNKGGDINNLHQAISYAEAVVAAVQEETCRASCIFSLSHYLEDRHEAIGDINDLNQTILYAREALAIIPQGHIDKPDYSATLASRLEKRFESSGAASDLREAILYCEEAVATTPRDHLNRSPHLILMTELLAYRYERTHDIGDLEQVISMLEEAAVAGSPENDDIHLDILGSLSDALISRYLRIDDISDIHKAILYSEMVIAARPKGSDYRLTGLLGLMRARIKLDVYLYEVAEDSNVSVNRLRLCLREILEVCQEVWEAPESSTTTRMDATILVSNITMLDKYFSTIDSSLEGESGGLRLAMGGDDLLVQSSIHLLPTVVPRALGRGDQERSLSSVTGVTPLAASWAFEAGKTPYEVLELLELSRGLIMGFDIDCRSDISDLEATDPALAAKFRDLRRMVDTASLERATTISDRVESSFEQEVAYCQRQAKIVRRRQIATRELEEILVKIRKLPGYERFQRPPSADDLMAMAKDGPIVTFVSTECRSDAIIITSSAISSLLLPDLVYDQMPNWLRFGEKIRPKKSKKSSMMPQMKEYAGRNERMRKQLLWLWDVAVEPVLRELKFTNPDPANTKLPHIWWIGVGELSVAPFHAAGDHSPNSSRNAISCVISSYTANIKVLSYARERELDIINKPPGDSSAHLLLVTMPKTPGEKDLPDVGAEVSGILNVTEGLISTKHLESPSARSVLENFGSYNAMHFACHGISNAKTSSHSHLLLLKDSGERVDQLTVQDISQKNTKSSQLAYLSACSTARNSVLHMADEMIHIASGFQLAGFSHVLGTLWPSESEVCREVAIDFYRSLFNGQDKDAGHRKVGMAFHEAVKRARDKNPLLPSKWAPFVHMGA